MFQCIELYFILYIKIRTLVISIFEQPFWFWFSHLLLLSLSPVQFFVTPWTAACQASLSITNSWSLLKLITIESVMPSNHLILCHPLLLLPSIFPSIRVFPNESSLCIRWPKYWSFSFSISPSSEYLGLISFRISSRKQLNWRPWNFQLSYFLHKSCPS